MGRNTFSVKFDDDVAVSLIRYCEVMGYNKTDVIGTGVESHLGDVISSNVQLLSKIIREEMNISEIEKLRNTLMGE